MLVLNQLSAIIYMINGLNFTLLPFGVADAQAYDCRIPTIPLQSGRASAAWGCIDRGVASVRMGDQGSCKMAFWINVASDGGTDLDIKMSPSSRLPDNMPFNMSELGTHQVMLWGKFSLPSHNIHADDRWWFFSNAMHQIVFVNMKNSQFSPFAQTKEFQQRLGRVLILNNAVLYYPEDSKRLAVKPQTPTFSGNLHDIDRFMGLVVQTGKVTWKAVDRPDA